ncbi:MAG: hypothetical protein IPP46_19380 [Bacteroidetes bacterium]|nr:hypothetical protein [Bacteroidota bacterium]
MKPTGNDKSLSFILAFQQGEESGFALFFRTHYAALTLFAFKITGQKEAAEEIAGDAFLTAWQNGLIFPIPQCSNPSSILL